MCFIQLCHDQCHQHQASTESHDEILRMKTDESRLINATRDYRYCASSLPRELLRKGYCAALTDSLARPSEPIGKLPTDLL